MKTEKHGLRRFFIQLYIRYRDDDIPYLSAQLSFFLLLSLFPFLLFLLSLISNSSISVSDFIENLIRFMPDDVGKFFADTINEMVNANSPVLLSLGAVITILSASGGIGALSKGLNRAYDNKESRSFFKLKAMSVAFTIGIALLIMITLVFLIFGSVIGEFLSGFFTFPDAFLDLWVVLRYAVPIIIMFVMFSLLYVFVPCCGIRLKEALPGSIFSTAGWIIISLLFSFYVSNFANYTRVYGSIGGVIILLIWIYISSIIILLGGEINATFSYYRSNKKLDKYENQNILPSWLRKRLKKHS